MFPNGLTLEDIFNWHPSGIVTVQALVLRCFSNLVSKDSVESLAHLVLVRVQSVVVKPIVVLVLDTFEELVVVEMASRRWNDLQETVLRSFDSLVVRLPDIVV
jgi:hypothetical protein